MPDLLPEKAIIEISKEIYSDIAHPTLKEMGSIGSGIMKFVALPFKFLGLTAEQLEERYKIFIEKSINKVNKEAHCIPRAVVAAPLLDHVKFIFDEDSLAEMFSNLLASAMNKNIEKMVHPALVEIVKQMSPLDAEFLKCFFVDKNECLLKELEWNRGEKLAAFSLESLVRLGILAYTTQKYVNEISYELTNFGILLRNLCFMQQSVLSEEKLQMDIVTTKGAYSSFSPSDSIDLIFDINLSSMHYSEKYDMVSLAKDFNLYDLERGRVPVLLLRVCNMDSYSARIISVHLDINPKEQILPINELPFVIGEGTYCNFVFAESKNETFLYDIDINKTKIIVETESTKYDMEIPRQMLNIIKELKKMKYHL